MSESIDHVPQEPFVYMDLLYVGANGPVMDTFLALEVDPYGLPTIRMQIGDASPGSDGKSYCVKENGTFIATQNGVDALKAPWERLPFAGLFDGKAKDLFVTTVVNNKGIIARSLLGAFEEDRLPQDLYLRFIDLGNKFFNADFGQAFGLETGRGL